METGNDAKKEKESAGEKVLRILTLTVFLEPFPSPFPCFHVSSRASRTAAIRSMNRTGHSAGKL